MTIVLLNQYYPPAEAPTGVLLADLAERLAAAGHDVTVIASRRDYAQPRRVFAARERRAGVEVRRIRTTGFGRVSRAGRLVDYATFLAGALARLALTPRPRAVVALTTPPMLATLALSLGRRRGARTAFWVMDVYPDVAFALGVLRERSLAGGLLARLARRTLRRADVVVAIGETMAAHVRGHGARDVRTIHNWVAGAPIAAAAPGRSRLRAAWGWAERFVVMYSGNLGLASEFDTALDAAALLGDRPDVRLAFIGDGPCRAELERGARARGLANVEFRGPLPRAELADGLAAGDLHLVTLRPALAGLLVPSKIYGILAAGRPAIYVGPDESEVAAVLAAGRCGARVAPGDAAGLAALVRTYADDRARCAAEGARARRLFEERFERESALGRLVAVVEGLA